jgi:hypothetical protein
MDPILFASHGNTWASGAAALIALFAAFMSTGRSENELWRRFAVLSFVNMVFCLSGAIQNHASEPDLIFWSNAWNNACGILLAPAFLDFVQSFSGGKNRLISGASWGTTLFLAGYVILWPDHLMTREQNMVTMPLHYFHYTGFYPVFLAALFGWIGLALLELWRAGRETMERRIFTLFVLPACILWTLCGLWDTIGAPFFRIAMPVSWLGGLGVNVAFLAFVTRRSQEAFRIQEKHRSVMRDVSQARDIQLGLISNDFPLLRTARVYGKYAPMAELGGDFYSVRRLNQSSIGFFMSDVTGHGIASAFITAMIKISLDGLASESLQRPDVVLNHLNQSLLDKTMNRFVTGAYGVLDEESLTFKFCSAGHHPPLLYYNAAKDAVEELEARGRLLAAFDDLQLSERTIPLAPGDRILLATDGFYEAFSERGEMFGMQRLKDIFKRDLHTSLDPLLLAIHRFTNGARQADDMAGLLIVVS